MKWKIWVRKIHKWLGLLLGLQFLLWVTGGVVMSWLPIEQVRGTYWLPADDNEILLSEYSFPVNKLPVSSAESVELAVRLGTPVYLVRRGQSRQIYDAKTGQLLPSVAAEEAARYARSRHRLHPKVVSTVPIEVPEGEVRGRIGPLWQVTLADPWNMRVYIDAVTGEVVARRNDLWRFYDFFWMLHIMDYGAREDFNNNLLRSGAALGWFFALSGIWLLFYSFRRSDFRIKRKTS